LDEVRDLLKEASLEGFEVINSLVEAS